ncbi:type II secretion system F family protein [Candidatus Jorgensenbacteria bacterium]|nr:type II secretion system F family protein [Candidatus Jorgensenbacteria bacterium]
MPRFFYVVQDKNNLVSKGVLDAPDRERALRSLLQKGLRPIKLESVTAEEEKKGKKLLTSRIKLPAFAGGSLSLFDQLMIVRQLGIILSTGTDLLSAIEVVAKDAIKPIIKQILYDIRSRVARGEKLSDAIAKWQKHFDPVFPSLVRSGELSGNLPGILNSYAQELKKDYTFVRKLKGALFYPVILITSLFGMMILILSMVAPRLKELFSQLKATPPFYTRILLAASDIWRNNMITIIVLLIVLILFLFIAFRNRQFRLKLIPLFRYIPIINRIQTKITLMRFCRTTASLIHAGFSLKSALKTTGEVVDVRYQKIITEMSEKSVEHGISLAESMKKYPSFFPDILISAIATGEKSGQLAVVFAQMSEFYEEDVIYSLETFLTILEPVLLLIVGAVVLLLALSIIAPVYRVIGKFR